jgi:hypothetical protein
MVIYGVAVEYSSSYVIDVRWILQVGFAFLIRTWVHHPVMGRWFDCLFVWWLCFLPSMEMDGVLEGSGWTHQPDESRDLLTFGILTASVRSALSSLNGRTHQP